MKQSGLEVVATYWHEYEAQIAKGLLESADIPAFVLDPVQIRMRWWMANALGGVKLAVPPSHLEQARELLELAKDVELEAGETCPSCGAAESDTKRAPRFWTRVHAVVMFALAMGAPAAKRAEYTCRSCGHEWT